MRVWWTGTDLDEILFEMCQPTVSCPKVKLQFLTCGRDQHANRYQTHAARIQLHGENRSQIFVLLLWVPTKFQRLWLQVLRVSLALFEGDPALHCINKYLPGDVLQYRQLPARARFLLDPCLACFESTPPMDEASEPHFWSFLRVLVERLSQRHSRPSGASEAKILHCFSCVCTGGSMRPGLS
jgi:hypothetical protein